MSERLRGSERRDPRSGARSRERTAAKARRQRIFWAVVLLGLVACGTVLAATSEGSIVRSAAAIVLLGGAAVLVVSLAFLEVGLSEDEERSSRFGRPGRDGDVDPELEKRSDRFFK
jgi:peptidoglycan/LPS O-acetylase OafA/YrhL